VYGDEIQKGLKRGLKPRHVSVSASHGVELFGVLDHPPLPLATPAPTRHPRSHSSARSRSRSLRRPAHTSSSPSAASSARASSSAPATRWSRAAPWACSSATRSTAAC
jgi:hypothetical protein